MTSDLDLLRQFARENSQDAFTEIVRRHVNLVYSAALRQVRSPQLAEEVGQSVFADLARDAVKLNSETILTAWLYSVTRRTAIDVIRKESRRQLREQIAVEMNDMNATANDWTQIEPLLDDAMAALDETDRAAILLRYFENKNLREVGESLKISDDAAQKRVSRAVEKLREFFAKKKITIGAGGLAVLISANAVQSAPVGLAATISTAAIFAGTAVHASTVIAATKTIAMTTLQKTFLVTALTAAIGTGIFEARQTSQLREQNQSLQQQQTNLTGQIQQLQNALTDLTNRFANVLAENASLKSGSSQNELFKLRGENARLRTYASSIDKEIGDAAPIAENLTSLKSYFEQHPEAKIPEFQFLDKEDWVTVAASSDVNAGGIDRSKAYRHAAGKLRSQADQITGEMFTDALAKYKDNNNGQFPPDVSQLKPYLERSKNRPDSNIPIEDIGAILDRWKIIPASQAKGMIAGGDMLITQKAPVDELFDDQVVIGNGWLTRRFVVTDTFDVLAPVQAAYNVARGTYPQDLADLQPYATTPEQKAAVEKIIQNERWTLPTTISQ